MSEIEAYARGLARMVADGDRPYATLKWWAENHLPAEVRPYAVEIYLAGVNILKSQGIEDAKSRRKPLTTLTKAERVLMRKQGKELASMLQSAIGLECFVSRRPIWQEKHGARLEIKIVYGKASICPTREKLQEWAGKSYLGKRISVQNLVSRLRSPDKRIAERIEVIRADNLS